MSEERICGLCKHIRLCLSCFRYREPEEVLFCPRRDVKTTPDFNAKKCNDFKERGSGEIPREEKYDCYEQYYRKNGVI